jgi:hypothetical protein
MRTVRGGLPPLVMVSGPPLPPVSHGPGVLCCGKGLGKTMNTFYAIIFILAAAVVVTVAFLVITDLTP